MQANDFIETHANPTPDTQPRPRRGRSIETMKLEIYRSIAPFLTALALGCPVIDGDRVCGAEPEGQALGRFFTKTRYEPAPLPRFEATRDQLPAPIYDEINGRLADLVATPNGNEWSIRVRSDGPFRLKVAFGGSEKTLAVKQGDNAFEIQARNPAHPASPQ